MRVIQTDVEDDYLTAAIASEKRSALDCAEAERDIRSDALGMLASRRIEATRDVECRDGHARQMHSIYLSDRRGNPAARLALEAGAEKRVDRHACFRVGVDELDRVERGRALGNRIGSLRGRRLDDSHINAGTHEAAGDDPAISTVVVRTDEHNRARVQPIGETTRDLIGCRFPGALHQDPRWSSAVYGCPIALR